MEHGEKEYRLLKSAYAFLNRQISLYEKTVERKVAEYNLLREIGNYTKASKVQLTRYRKEVYSLVNEWKFSEKKNAGEAEEGTIFLTDRNWTELFQQKKSVYIRDIEHLPEQLQGVYMELKKESIRSIFALPVFNDTSFIGIITICDPDTEKIKEIEEIHEILGNWLGHRLIKNDNRIQKTLSGLGADYTAAYMINLDTDHFEVIINQKSNNAAKQKKDRFFTDYLRKYADKYVLEKDCEAMKTELCAKNLRKRFAVEEDFHFTFETIPNELGQTCFQAHAVRECGDDGNYAILGFRCVDELIKKDREYKEKLDQAYRLVRKQLDIITSAIPGGIKISNDDESYSFKYVSEQYAAMLGYTVEEFMEASNGSVVGIAHPDDLESGIAEALEQYKKADHYEITYRMRCKDGSWKYIEDHGHKVFAPDGKIEHWNLILDKNELVQKTIELESEKKANAAKTAFLSRMSHDIRTPLNGIIGLLEIDRRHADDLQMISENREKARVAADHLLSLINDILELNKLNDANVVLCEEAFDVRKLIREIKTITEMRAAEDGIQMYIEGDDTELKCPYAVGSPLHIRQIFINIITNAIKYNKPGGAVYCSFKEQVLPDKRAGYEVQIRDTGIGMTEEFLKNIFQPFTQENQDARSVYQGTGLGMPIVKNLIDRMGGTLRIESEAGVGTTVYVSLSLPVADKITSTEHEQKRPEKQVNLAGVKVLLAEDNELNREIAKVLLEDEKMIVTEVCDGRQALETFAENPAGTFDLILMDVMMPVMGGLEAAREIRSSGKEDAKTIPIFAMTANAFTEDRQQTREAGMNEHIAKPLDAKLLMRKIMEYCKRRDA